VAAQARLNPPADYHPAVKTIHGDHARQDDCNCPSIPLRKGIGVGVPAPSSLSLWERAGVRVLARMTLFSIAPSEAPSPGLRPASPRGRGEIHKAENCSSSLSLWERVGVRVLARMTLFSVAPSEAPSPGLRPASPRGRGEKRGPASAGKVQLQSGPDERNYRLTLCRAARNLRRPETIRWGGWAPDCV
jgi:hypothetical protein